MKEFKISSKTKINIYEGKDGLLQVTLNSLNAKEVLYIYEMSYASLNDFLSEEKAENIRQKFLDKNIKIKELTNIAFHNEYTKIKEFHERCMEIRYIPSDKLDITTEFLIYNNTVTFYTYKSEFYAVEIYDEKLAHMQKQIFDFLWNLADKPMIGGSGKTSIF